MVPRSKEGAGASIKDGQSFLEEQAPGKGRPSLGSMGHLCFSGRVRSTPPQLPEHRASTAELQEEGWNVTRSKDRKGPTLHAKRRGWLSQGPFHVFDVQVLVSDTGPQVGSEAGADGSGEWGGSVPHCRG